MYTYIRFISNTICVCVLLWYTWFPISLAEFNLNSIFQSIDAKNMF